MKIKQPVGRANSDLKNKTWLFDGSILVFDAMLMRRERRRRRTGVIEPKLAAAPCRDP